MICTGMICRADNSGLGNQTWEMFRHLKPAKVLIMDISLHNGHTNHFERYDNDWGCEITIHKSKPCQELLTDEAIDLWIENLDLVVTTEIPYNYNLFSKCRGKGIKSILIPNFEFLDYTNRPTLPKPDLFLVPSMWHFEDMKALHPNTKYVPVPVNRDLLPFRKINQAKTFIHVAGVELYEDRNGTGIVLEAIKHVKSDVKFIIYSQHKLDPELSTRENIEIRYNIDNYFNIYKEGDVLLLPRRFGGLTLQLNEAMSCGMIPIMPNISPQNEFLHPASLISTCGSKKIMTRGAELKCYDVSPKVLASRIDQLAQLRPDETEKLNEYSNQYAESISWEKLKSVYLTIFEEVRNG